MADDAVDAYDRVAGDYAGSNPGTAARAGYEWPAVRAALPDVEGLAVLDAACGSGHYAAWMADRGPMSSGSTPARRWSARPGSATAVR